MPNARVMEVITDLIHPETGETLITEEVIKDALAHRSISRWAYIIHDKDLYTEKDEQENPEHKAGTPKPPHVHVAMEMSRPNDVEVVAKWFNVPSNFIKFWKGQGAFLDAVQYATHEHPNQQALGKYHYPDEEVTANFDFRKALTEREEEKLKYGKNLSPRDRMRYDVLYNGVTLRQCMEKDRYLYMDDLEKLKKFRLEYIGMQTPPNTRINYYVEGKGGIGKGLICRAIARNLFPQYENDEDIFFSIGGEGVSLDGYDGQPVIIWNDKRAVDLLMALQSRGNVFNVFDTHPTKQNQNIKYGKINLCNVVNIVNSVQPYEEFLNSLAGEYSDRFGNEQQAEDKDQSYRRFPFMILLHKEDFDFLINKGFIDDTATYREYLAYNNIRGNMKKIAGRCGANVALARKLESKTVKPITDKHFEVMEKIEHTPIDEEAILAEFADYGKVVEVVETVEEKRPPIIEDGDDYFK